MTECIDKVNLGMINMEETGRNQNEKKEQVSKRGGRGSRKKERTKEQQKNEQPTQLSKPQCTLVNHLPTR